jgi:pyruvate,water dikinase
MRDAIAEAVALAGIASRKAQRESDIVISVAGRLAVDLDLIGANDTKGRFRRMFAFGDKGRRLKAAWRVGRLRVVLPSLSGALVTEIDDALLSVDDLSDLDDVQLVGTLRRAQDALRAAHGLEILAGLIMRDVQPTHTGAGAALAALTKGRADGLSDAEIVQRTPVVLALLAPHIGAPQALPVFPAPAPQPERATTTSSNIDERGVAREALRLRARWIHELMARISWELGRRLARRRAISSAAAVRVLRLDELEAMVRGAQAPVDLVARMDAPESQPLPVAFRRHPDGTPIPVSVGVATANGAGGGRGSGPVHSGDGPPPAGSVLVVRTLDPDLAPLLPQLGGLVAESGSVLSHLAILAREFGVPTAVGVRDATTRFRPGAVVEVDGGTGDVIVLSDPDSASHDAGALTGGAR